MRSEQRSEKPQDEGSLPSRFTSGFATLREPDGIQTDSNCDTSESDDGSLQRSGRAGIPQRDFESLKKYASTSDETRTATYLTPKLNPGLSIQVVPRITMRL